MPRSPVHLVYLGQHAALAAAASLRALRDSKALLMPPGVPDDLKKLIQETAGRQAIVQEPVALNELPAEPVTIAIAGAHGPPLAVAVLQATRLTAREVLTTPPQPLFDECLIGQRLISLQRITAILRQECPWDRVQTAQDIISHSLEEMYELADAIARRDLGEQHGELGDVLFQVYFLSLLLAEQHAGDLGSVAAEIERKLIRRHAHIFADAVAETPAAVRGQWERIKREQEGREGIFHDVPATLSALLFARKLQRRAAEVGFDWDSVLQAFPKIAEEHGELADAMSAYGELPGLHGTYAQSAQQGAPSQGESEAPSDLQERMRHDPALRHEFGDLLFAVVNVARKAGVDPELALREAAQRFERRVTGAAEMAAAEGRDWAQLGLDEQERYYQRAKVLEKKGQG